MNERNAVDPRFGLNANDGPRSSVGAVLRGWRGGKDADEQRETDVKRGRIGWSLWNRQVGWLECS